MHIYVHIYVRIKEHRKGAHEFTEHDFKEVLFLRSFKKKNFIQDHRPGLCFFFLCLETTDQVQLVFPHVMMPKHDNSDLSISFFKYYLFSLGLFKFCVPFYPVCDEIKLYIIYLQKFY